MKQVQGQPITGSRVPQRRRFVLANQAETSSTAQRQIRLPDTPQQDPQLRVPAPTNPAYRSSSNLSQFARSTLGRSSARSVREMADPDFAAVGYERNATKPKRPGTSIISGYPTRGNKRVAGDGSQPLAKGIKVKQFRTNRDIFSPRVLHEAGLTRL